MGLKAEFDWSQPGMPSERFEVELYEGDSAEVRPLFTGGFLVRELRWLPEEKRFDPQLGFGTLWQQDEATRASLYEAAAEALRSKLG